MTDENSETTAVPLHKVGVQLSIEPKRTIKLGRPAAGAGAF